MHISKSVLSHLLSNIQSHQAKEAGTISLVDRRANPEGLKDYLERQTEVEDTVFSPPAREFGRPSKPSTCKNHSRVQPRAITYTISRDGVAFSECKMVRHWPKTIRLSEFSKGPVKQTGSCYNKPGSGLFA